MISVIIPLYNEQENIVHYPADLFPIIDDIGKRPGETIEYIFVDDGEPGRDRRGESARSRLFAMM